MPKHVNYAERAERAKLILDLHTIAERWLETDCAVSSVVLGAIAALKAGVSHELAIYMLDFSKACLSPEMKSKLIYDLNLLERQKELVIKSANHQPAVTQE